VVPVKLRLEAEEATKQLLHRVEPMYPSAAKAAGVDGTVLLEIIIGVDGSVTEVREIDGPTELIAAAVAAVKQWQYKPIIYRGRAWQATTEVEVRFKLPQ
jgi:protein TonB